MKGRRTSNCAGDRLAVRRNLCAGPHFSNGTDAERRSDRNLQALVTQLARIAPRMSRPPSGAVVVELLTAVVEMQTLQTLRTRETDAIDPRPEVRHSAALLRAGALQAAIFNSAHFSSIATDAAGVIQIFNVGAERMLGYAAADLVNQNTPADISDPQEIIARAKALSVEMGDRKRGV